ncbi:MAG: SMI1/KNR4 family protein [Pirellulales bacterium]|nr:SMI1/KNR4 family protein [Pirellulales bacterium]
MEDEFLTRVAVAFPEFAVRLGDGSAVGLENVQPPATDADLREMEETVGVPLPESYKRLLRCGREFWLLGGVVQFGFQHPFVHEFEPLDTLTPQQQRSVKQKGGSWPPPSQGMVCFAEFFMEADGDQVLFDVSGGPSGGEYPVMYYAHESRPPSVRRLAVTFPEFLAAFLDYPGFAREE